MTNECTNKRTLPANCGKVWTKADNNWLLSMHAQNVGLSIMADRLRRTQYGTQLQLERLLEKGDVKGRDGYGDHALACAPWTDHQDKELIRMALLRYGMEALHKYQRRPWKETVLRLIYLCESGKLSASLLDKTVQEAIVDRRMKEVNKSQVAYRPETRFGTTTSKEYKEAKRQRFIDSLGKCVVEGRPFFEGFPADVDLNTFQVTIEDETYSAAHWLSMFNKRSMTSSAPNLQQVHKEDNMSVHSIHNLLGLMQEDFTTVHVKYAGTARYYTFKADLALNLKEGDKVIVPNANGLDGGYVVVEVRKVDATPCLEPTAIQLKWVVQKLDTTAYDKRLASEEAAMEVLAAGNKRAEQKAALAVLLNGTSADYLRQLLKV